MDEIRTYNQEDLPATWAVLNYSIRINDQWRICFRWPKDEPGPSNVEIVDYH